ncbi:MAG: hypothetical protein TEF_04410 [Rhizobiales bacterium NRL2]|nr:MAG: hypothetical protein TEF_04410 [Rhizobiales bacterium NRL2]
METRASHLLIGSVVLIFTLAFFGFAIWISQAGLDEAKRVYDIFIRGSVAGLSVGGDVRYRGIKVGSVTDIRIDPDDPTQVRTVVEIDEDVPIREGDIATLKLQGITGVAYVNIEGAAAKSPPLTTPPLAPRPIIPSAPSDIEKLFSGAPELLSRAIVVTERLADLLGSENQESIGGILSDLKTVTGTLAGQDMRIDSVLRSLDSSAADIAATMKSARQLVDRSSGVIDDAEETLAVARGAMTGVDQVVTKDARALIGELRQTNRDLGEMMSTLNGLLQNNEEYLSSFANDGLGEFQRFITEARLLIASLSRLTERLEAGGAQSLFGSGGAVVERNQ